MDDIMPPTIRTDIFVAAAYFKDDLRVRTRYVHPIHSGRALASTDLARRMSDMIGDDTGENISQWHPLFSDLTAIYWMLKNVDAEYYGLLHYSRLFDLCGTTVVGGLPFGYRFNEQFEANRRRYDECLEQVVSSYDMLVTAESRGIWNPQLVPAVFRRFGYEEASDLPINVCELFVMRRDIFHECWSFIFDLCFDAKNRADSLGRPLEHRSLAFQAEDAFGTYCHLLEKHRSIRTLRRTIIRLPDLLDRDSAAACVSAAMSTSSGRAFVEGRDILPGEEGFRRRLLAAYSAAQRDYRATLEHLDSLGNGENTRYHNQPFLVQYAEAHVGLGEFDRAAECIVALIEKVGNNTRDNEMVDQMARLVLSEPAIDSSLAAALNRTSATEDQKNVFGLLLSYARGDAPAVLRHADGIRTPPKWLVVDAYRGWALAAIGTLDEAFEAFVEVIRLIPCSWEAQGVARQMGMLAEKRPEFRRRFAEVVETLPVPQNTRTLLSLEFHRIGNDHEGTIALADRLLTGPEPTRNAALYKSVALRKLGRLEEALAWAEEEARWFGDSAQIEVQRSIILRRQLEDGTVTEDAAQRVQQMIESLESAADREPLCHWANSELGWLHEWCGDVSAAERCFQKERDLQPNNSVAANNVRRIGLKHDALKAETEARG